jgi:amino acid permease
VTHVSTATQSGTRSSGKLVGTVILAIVGVVAIVVGLIYAIEPEKSLPSFLGSKAGSTGHRPLHLWTALVVGVILLALAAWNARSRSGGGSSAEN